MSALTPEQARAVERRDGSLLVRAGAGTGKTTVLVERFVRAVVDDGAAVESILAITFTEKAAAEMKTRVRRRFLELGRRDDARAAEGAWISTIHGFCSRILRTHALSAGIDPDFRVLDQIEAERLALEAFDGALEAFLAEGADPERIEMVAAYTPDKLRDMVRTAYSHLRSRGQRRPALEPTVAPLPAGERERLDAAARAALAELGGGARRRDGARARSSASRRRSTCSTKLDDGRAPGGRRAEGARAQGAREGALDAGLRGLPRGLRRAPLARAHAPGAARPHDAARPARALRRALRAGQARALRARLRGPRAGRRATCSRATPGCASPTRALRARAGRRVPGHQPAPERAARAARARQPVPGRRREPVDLPLPQRRRGRVPRATGTTAVETGRAESITVNFRARGEILDAIDLAFDAHLGGALRAAARGARVARAGAARRSVRRAARGRQAARRAGRPRSTSARAPSGPRCQTAPPWRAAEARLLAKRVDELTARGPLLVRRRRDAVPGDHRHGLLRARARGARHPRARGGRARLLGPAAGRRTCATGCPRSPTRSTSSRSTRCSPRRSPACRSTRSR